MNHLFGTYLEEKGFDVHRASATIHTPDGGRSLEGSHMSLYTKIDGIYYVTDVGFGDLPLHAIPILMFPNLLLSLILMENFVQF